MQDNPKISVIVPVYNTGKYLHELYRSLADQTLQDFEVIFVDDGSTDESLEILNQLAGNDDRIAVFSQENKGGAAARNKGLDEAKGELLICVDSDDFFEKDLLEKMSGPFDDPTVDLVYCNMNTYSEATGEFAPMPWAVRESPENEPFPPQELPNLYYDVMGFIANKMFRRSLVENNGLRFQEIRSHDDLSIVYTLMSAARNLYYVGEELYHYRKRDDASSVTDTTMNELYRCAYLALEDLKTNLVRLGIWDEFEIAFINYAIYLTCFKYGRAPSDIKDAMREDLRDEWFRRLDLLGHPRGTYLHDDEYEFISTVLFYDENEKNARKLKKARKEIEGLRAENADLKKSLEKIQGSKSYKLAKKLSKLARS